MTTARAGAAGCAATAVAVLGLVGVLAACGSPAEPPAASVLEPAERPSALADPERWDAPPPLVAGGGVLQAADLDELLPGRSDADRWHAAAVDMQPAWLRRACERTPVGEDGEPTAAAGLRPAGQSTQAWVRGRDAAGFTTTEVLRWSDDDGARSASAWVADVVGEASQCPGAAVVDPLEGSGDAAVVVRTDGDGRSSTVYALAAAGPTAFEVSTRAVAGGSVQESAAAASALLERTAARQLAADDAVRLSGVDDAALAAFRDGSDAQGPPPPLLGGAAERVPLVTETDLAAAFSGTGQWWAQPQPAVAGQWRTSWCDDRTSLPLRVDAPQEQGGPWALRAGGAADEAPPRVVQVDVLRWSAGAVAAPGSPAGYAWADAVRTDAADCRGARPAAGALPGSWSSAAVAADDDGGWRVQVATAGGPTAVRVRVHLAVGATEAEADAAATSAAALARRVVANVVRADADADAADAPPSSS